MGIKKGKEGQVLFNGMWINKLQFRAFVYKKYEKKVADNWDEYQNYLKSGWFETQELADHLSKEEKPVEKPIKVKKYRKHKFAQEKEANL